MNPTTVLLIRVNSTHELFHTRTAPDLLHKAFPNARLLTLATPQTETLNLLRNDPRFEDVLVFPPDEAADKSPAALRRFLAAKNIDITVACHGTLDESNYQRHALSLLLCPGRKFLMDKQGRVYPLLGARGVRTMAQVIGGAFWGAVTQRMARMVARPRTDSLVNLAAERDAGSIKRILWIRLDNIGDVVMSLPALRALQANFPKAQVDVLVQSCSKPIFADLPDIGEVFVYNPPHMLKSAGQRSSKRDWLTLVRQLRRSRYDLAVETRGHADGRILAYASNARFRAGPARGAFEHPSEENLAGLMTHSVSIIYGSDHMSESSLKVVEGSGLTVAEPRYRFGLARGDDGAVLAALRELGITGGYAVVHGCTTDSMRQWPVERFAAVADHLVKQHRLDVLLTGAPGDTPFNEQVRNAAAQSGRIHNIAGKIPLRDLPALYENTRVMVTVDTGPMHIAAAVGTPIVALFLPWVAAIHYPFGQKDGVVVPFPGTVADAADQPNFTPWQGDFMGGITVDNVIEAIENKLGTETAEDPMTDKAGRPDSPN